MKIVYTPYRGKIEPITKVYKSEIELGLKHIEITTYYDFESFTLDTLTHKSDFIKTIALFQKDNISITFNYVYHEADDSEETYPRIEIWDVSGSTSYIHVGNEEGLKVYSQLKKWLLEDEISTS